MNAFESLSLPENESEELLFSEIIPEDLEISARILKKAAESVRHGKDASIDDLNGLPCKLSEAGFSEEERGRIMGAASEADIADILKEIQESDRALVNAELEKADTQKMISEGVRRLSSIFEDAGVDISEKNIRVEHGGKVVRLINNIVKHGFVPVAATESGEHFAKQGRTNVYHTGKESAEMIATLHVHEKAHGLGYNDHKEHNRGESRMNGFSRIEYDKEDPLKSTQTFNTFDEGFTERLARKSLENDIDYDSMPVKAYDDEVAMVEAVITAVAVGSQSSEDDIERELVKAYASPDGAERLKNLVNSACGEYAYVFLSGTNAKFFEALAQFAKTGSVSEKVDIQARTLEAEGVDAKEFVARYPFSRVINHEMDFETGRLRVEVVAE